jgi:hypothetical protein
MKHKVCISVDEETLIKVKKAVREHKFRNKSHVFEFCVNEVIRE